MTDTGETEIPTPRAAMAEAVAAARRNDPALARVWLDIATEIRRGTSSAPEPSDPREAEERLARAGLRPGVPAFAAHPRTLEERTQTFRKAPAPLVGVCRHCHTPITRGDAGAEWRHKYTEQVVCAVPMMAPGAGADAPWDTAVHTFAEPATEVA